jgi:hypothetical protein
MELTSFGRRCSGVAFVSFVPIAVLLFEENTAGTDGFQCTRQKQRFLIFFDVQLPAAASSVDVVARTFLAIGTCAQPSLL